MKFVRYGDRCYAVVVGKRRGPVAHDKVTARKRFKKSGLIARADKDNTRLTLNAAARILAARARGVPIRISWPMGVRMAAALMRQYRRA